MLIAFSLYPCRLANWLNCNWLFHIGNTNSEQSLAVNFSQKCIGIYCLWELGIPLKCKLLNGLRSRKYNCIYLTSLGNQVRNSCQPTLTSQKKKESESPSKLLNIAELLDIVTKIIQGNRMSISFLMSLGGEPFATFWCLSELVLVRTCKCNLMEHGFKMLLYCLFQSKWKMNSDAAKQNIEVWK